MGEMSSFYGGRRGFSFILKKTFDGYDIPQPDTDITVTDWTYGKAYYAVNTNGKFIITDAEHGGNVQIDDNVYLIKRNGTNYSEHNWQFHDNDGSAIDDTVYSFPTVVAQGMKQCFDKGVNSLEEVGYGQFVIIDSIVNMCNWDDPDNGKIYQRGGDFNDIHEDRYICQITGPKGDTILVDMDHFSVIEAIDPHLEITYSETSQDLVPGTYMDDGVKKFNDNVKFAYTYIRNSLGNIEKCLIGFRIPTLVEEYEARSMSPYEQRATDPETGKYYNYNLIAEDENYYVDGKWVHPFYQKWQIKVPHGYHGINSSNFEFVPIKTKPKDYGHSGYAGARVYSDTALTQPYLVDGAQLILETSYDTLRDADYESGQTWMAVRYNNEKVYVSIDDCYVNILRYRETNFDNLEAGEVTYYELCIFETGHVVMDQNGIEMPKRDMIQFEGQVDVTDDQVNNKTKVEILRQPGAYFGTADGQASNQIKLVSVPASQVFILKPGTTIHVKFDADNTYSATSANPIKLNVNGTGAKQIYYLNSGEPIGTNTTAFGRANYINQYIYDGTYWVWQGSSGDNDEHYSPQVLGIGYGTCSTAEATTSKIATLTDYALVQNGVVAIKFQYGVPAGSSLDINNKGAKAIYYRGSAITDDIILAGYTAIFFYDGTHYHLTSVDYALVDEVADDVIQPVTSNAVFNSSVNFNDSQTLTDAQKTQAKTNIGLENVGNFKAVSTVAAQGLTDQEKYNAKQNLGLDKSGNYKAVSLEGDQGNTSAEKLVGRGNIDAVGSTVVEDIQLVTALPADASDHPEILYLIYQT